MTALTAAATTSAATVRRAKPHRTPAYEPRTLFPQYQSDLLHRSRLLPGWGENARPPELRSSPAGLYEASVCICVTPNDIAARETGPRPTRARPSTAAMPPPGKAAGGPAGTFLSTSSNVSLSILTLIWDTSECMGVPRCAAPSLPPLPLQGTTPRTSRPLTTRSPAAPHPSLLAFSLLSGQLRSRLATSF